MPIIFWFINILDILIYLYLSVLVDSGCSSYIEEIVNNLFFRLATSYDNLEKCRLRIENKQKELAEVEQQLSQFDQNNLNNTK